MTEFPDLPGLSIRRLCRLMEEAVVRCGLDLSNMVILTEAASGAYVVTPILAAMAKARRVYAFTRSTRYGTVSDVTHWTMKVASEANVADRICIIEALSPNVLNDVDIITNSGHLRPIGRTVIEQLPTRSVVALMFEAWEFRPGDIDTEACLMRQIPIVGVNENHASIDVFSYLGPLCVKLLQDAGVAVYNNRIAVLCDNGFSASIMRGLTQGGADASLFPSVSSVKKSDWDAIVVALQPGKTPRVDAKDAVYLSSVSPAGTVLAQFWGDIDREAIEAAGLMAWPPSPPPRGHMGILLSAIGPDPIIRLQAGGLRAAQAAFRKEPFSENSIAQYIDLTRAIC